MPLASRVDERRQAVPGGRRHDDCQQIRKEGVTMGILDGRVAVITAAGSGMGRAAAQRFAQEGATLVVTDIDIDAARGTEDLIQQDGGKAVAMVADVGDLDGLRNVADAVTTEFGAVHVLFNHAGIPGPPGIGEVTPEQWARVVDLNMRGGFFLTQYLLDGLRAASGASVVFTSSAAGLVGSQFSPLYSMVKGGLVSLVKGLALSLAADDIRVNAVCPGSTDTPMLPSFYAGGTDEDIEAKKRAAWASIPLGRLGAPQDVAEAALFLAAPTSGYITGVALPVDGGYTAK
jgi:NAD(P)-dependent dehydrogenase (short-subunit alcohol dehydrogenase family)